MNVLAFAASNSKKSINKQLATYATTLVANADIEILDINDYEMAIFSEDREKETGIPNEAHQFFKKITDCDLLIISFAEHNGSYSAAYKNLFDWASRIDMKVFQNKATILLSTSPGPGGASSVLATAAKSAPYFAANVKASLSVPSFYDNFDVESGQLTNDSLKTQLLNAISAIA